MLRQGDYEGVHHRRRAFREMLAPLRRDDRATLLEIVFGELITNAVRYGDDPMSVLVAIDDLGVRISVDNAGSCYDLTQRLLTAPTTSGGRGLSIVRALVDTMTVENLQNPSCRVTVTATF